MVTRELLIFIQNERARGVSPDAITLTLVKEGWEMNDIHEAFSMATHFKTVVLKDMPEAPLGPNADQNPVLQHQKNTRFFLHLAITALAISLSMALYMLVPPLHSAIDLWIRSMREALLL